MMRQLGRTLLFLATLAALSGAPTASAEVPAGEGVTVSINTLGSVADYPVLSRGQVVLINAQRFVVTREPRPRASVAEQPPEPQAIEVEAERPPAPSKNAVWVAGHWIYGPTGFSWVAGRYIASRPGHVFVPPRWAEHEDQYLYFAGFYVPHNVYVQSHFNRYYYTGAPKHGSHATHGPYWPVGAPTRANSASTRANASDPYWPIGARR